ncbi:sulfotransferase [Pleurocapsa sp. PCC 7319]|uniref:sulfotransferase family protein n=1 Tax=Pleurocapsa sp. PCC 7319 TaxID=118161 RepID=UPI000344C883|nr:sulfotransferase [Pleurocapsa sp. PCC 7319]
MKILETNKPLALIVCGFAGGGTTMLGEMLRQHPKLDSGFEGGLLLAEDAYLFKSIEPHYSSLKKMWQVSDEEMDYICAADTWSSVYQRLLDISPIIKDKSVYLFDKTPLYMKKLPNILSKVPNVPCIVLVRDPRAYLWTRTKRTYKNAPLGMTKVDWAEKTVEQAGSAYLKFARGYKRAISSQYASRILLVQYESLCTNPEAETKKIFDFIELDFDKDYLTFHNKDSRYTPCHGQTVSTDYLEKYKNELPEKIQKKMLQITKNYKNWFWQQ